jgi:hypothetical protein
VLASVGWLAVAALPLHAQERTVAEITVNAGRQVRNNLPVSASLDGIPLQTYPHGITLYEVSGNRTTPVPVQVRPGDQQQLTFILSGRTAPNATRRYQLRVNTDTSLAASAPSGARVNVQDTGENLNISIAGKQVLSYRYTPQPVPAGVDSVFSSSGFIHPLYSPQGQVLTRMQPRDHWHHYGLWNPWTHTRFEGRQVDFWNIGSRQGRVRATGVLERTSGEVYGSFRAAHEFVDYTSGAPKIPLREQWEVTVWNAAPDQGVWLIDFASTLSPATDSAITIEAYRYQGLGMRATGRWGDSTSTFITSEGKDKSNANATRARWMNVAGVSGAREGTSGVLFFTTPTNYNYPEELRIWPTGQNGGVENVFVNFNPAQTRDWVLEPGQTYRLRYRMIVYDGQMSNADAEAQWQSYANPPQVTVRVVSNLQ